MADHELNVREKQEVSREEGTRAGRTYLPNVDIYETDKNLVLCADMPGVDERSINVNLENGMLTIEGHVSVQEYENLEPVYTEYRVGNYLRRFTLSNEIDAERIGARIADGVLELTLPKSERAKPRRIAITT